MALLEMATDNIVHLCKPLCSEDFGHNEATGSRGGQNTNLILGKSASFPMTSEGHLPLQLPSPASYDTATLWMASTLTVSITEMCLNRKIIHVHVHDTTKFLVFLCRVGGTANNPWNYVTFVGANRIWGVFMCQICNVSRENICKHHSR
jgi:hypothetical protein